MSEQPSGGMGMDSLEKTNAYLRGVLAGYWRKVAGYRWWNHPIRLFYLKRGRLAADGKSILPPQYWYHETGCGCTACQQRRRDDLVSQGRIMEHAPVPDALRTAVTPENSKLIELPDDGDIPDLLAHLLVRGNPLPPPPEIIKRTRPS